MREGETHYTATSGIVELKTAIAKFTKEEYGFEPSLKQIAIVPANALIDFVIRCICNEDDEVIITDPCFSTYISVLNYTGIKSKKIVLSPANNYKLCAEDIEKAITKKTKLVVVNSPSNPTGSIIDEEEIKKIYQLCKKHDLYMLSDEVYSTIFYGGVFSSPSQYDYCNERVLLLKSFSKTYSMTGFRLGYIIAPEILIDKVSLLFQTIFSCMPMFIQRGGIAALEMDQKRIGERTSYLKECRDMLVEGLNSIPNIACNTPEGAFYVFPDISETGYTGVEFSNQLLEKYNVAVLPGISFGDSSVYNVRLCYATQKKNISNAIERIRKFICQPK